MKTLIVIIVTAFMLASCATIIDGSKQKVVITSDPSGASIYVDGAPKGVTPMQTKIPRKSKSILFLKDGYKDKAVSLDQKTNGTYWANLALLPLGIISCPIGMWIDVGTGAVYKVNESITIKLEQK